MMCKTSLPFLQIDRFHRVLRTYSWSQEMAHEVNDIRTALQLPELYTVNSIHTIQATL